MRLSVVSRCLLLCLFILSFGESNAEMKVLERSASKTPEWLKQKPVDHLLVMVYGSNLAEAQHEAEAELLRQVVGSIAVNVRSEVISEMGVKEGDEWETFVSRVDSRSAALPFLTDVTLAKSSDTYWERSVDKKSGEENYALYILYPFDSVTRGKLIAEYTAYDRGMEDKLNTLERHYEEIASFEELTKGEAELKSLSEWFPDAQRQTRACKLQDLYRSLRKDLHLLDRKIGKGEYLVSVQRGGKPFKMSGRLEVKSNCASQIKVISVEDGWRITFNTEDCLEWEENSLNLTLKTTGLTLKSEIFL